MQARILDSLRQELEKLRREPETFGTDGPGVVVSLGPAEIKTLRRTGPVLFKLEPVYPETTKDQSPFAGWANIRLDTVRVWVDGAVTSDGELRCTSHIGGASR